jgi:hypothetical protein
VAGVRGFNAKTPRRSEKLGREFRELARIETDTLELAIIGEIRVKLQFGPPLPLLAPLLLGGLALKTFPAQGVTARKNLFVPTSGAGSLITTGPA